MLLWLPVYTGENYTTSSGFRPGQFPELILLWILVFFSYIHVVFNPQDQYQFCYRAALEYLSSFDHYTDNWQSAGLELGVWANYVILRFFGKEETCSSNY